LFQHEGKAIKKSQLRQGFEKARQDVGLSKLIFHDTRRTAVDRMERAGIPRDEAMEITGHLTESVYLRYRIGAQKKATDAGKKLREYEQRRQNSFQNSFQVGAKRSAEADEKPDLKRLN
jgi:hypothetical protein